MPYVKDPNSDEFYWEEEPYDPPVYVGPAGVYEDSGPNNDEGPNNTGGNQPTTPTTPTKPTRRLPTGERPANPYADQGAVWNDDYWDGTSDYLGGWLIPEGTPFAGGDKKKPPSPTTPTPTAPSGGYPGGGGYAPGQSSFPMTPIGTAKGPAASAAVSMTRMS